MSKVRMASDDRIDKLAAALSDLEKLGVGDEVVQPLRDELQELRLADLEERVANLKSQAVRSESMGMVVPSAPPSPAPVAPALPELEQQAVEKSEALAEAEARAKAEALVAAEREAEEARAAARTQALVAIDGALRGIEYGTRACTADELADLRVAMAAARDVGVPASDIAMAEQLAQQAMDKSDALEAVMRDADARARERAEARAREAVELAAAQKRAAAAAAAAAEAEAERKAVAQEKVQAEMKAAMAEVRRSVSLPGVKRKKLLRDLQIKWHPDRQEDADEETKALALDLSMKINEAMRIAKENIRARGEL